jgi:hypothetical protein
VEAAFRGGEDDGADAENLSTSWLCHGDSIVSCRINLSAEINFILVLKGFLPLVLPFFPKEKGSPGTPS